MARCSPWSTTRPPTRSSCFRNNTLNRFVSPPSASLDSPPPPHRYGSILPRHDTSRGRTLNPFHASPTSPQPYQADKFVDAGFLMHWGEDMKSVPGSGGSSCTSPAPLKLQPISGLKRARFPRHAGCWFCRFSQEQLADSTRELGQVPEHGVSHS